MNTKLNSLRVRTSPSSTVVDGGLDITLIPPSPEPPSPLPESLPRAVPIPGAYITSLVALRYLAPRGGPPRWRPFNLSLENTPVELAPGPGYVWAAVPRLTPQLVPVCLPDHWSDTAAALACRGAGFGSGGVAAVPHIGSGGGGDGDGDGDGGELPWGSVPNVPWTGSSALHNLRVVTDLR